MSTVDTIGTEEGSTATTGPSDTRTVAAALAHWAASTEPSPADLELADRSLLDTVAVALAARTHEIRPVVDALDSQAARWAALAHVIDFDDLHLPSTTHISTVCVPVALATAGHDGARAARAYLAGAGVMARLGTALGWEHYTKGWHATTTAGAISAAVVAGVAHGLSEAQLTNAIALAVPASGGVQRAFGTDAKSLQVGMAAQAGIQAAQLAAAGASADPRAVEAWMGLLGGDPEHPLVADPGSDPAMIPDGLAIKVYPACYALQRPIGALRETAGGPLAAEDVTAIRLTTPRGTVTPLVHSRPQTGLEGKFSLEYAAATALLDPHSGFQAFGDEAVQRTDAQRLVGLTEITLTDEPGDGLLVGAVDVEVDLTDGRTVTGSLDLPPGSPGKPPTEQQMTAKVEDCLQLGGVTGVSPADISWATGARLLSTHLPAGT
ncbi:MmgE/PrpD family protein [Ornithinimicrobium cavernae]|uniref:MmgE/PrpD family protein n=1 Tax=Ornithinimicrobium cavernae TaxID=2666047 RepID=UPI00192A64F8|nr:MmgE/PrpD family protein [Ornithinimicrobium cavernae]